MDTLPAALHARCASGVSVCTWQGTGQWTRLAMGVRRLSQCSRIWGACACVRACMLVRTAGCRGPGGRVTCAGGFALASMCVRLCVCVSECARLGAAVPDAGAWRV